MDDLGSNAVRGVAWLSSGQAIRQVLAFVTNIALARMLFPDDFGLFGMTFVAAEIAQVLTDFGLGAAIIQRQERDQTKLVTCFWLNLSVGVLVALILVASGPLLVHYFARPEITLLVIPLALNMVIGASLVVPQALLSQHLRFREITIAQLIGSIAAAVVALSLAYAGAGVWALVAQPVVGNLTSGALLYAQSQWRPSGRAQLSSIKGMIRFSGSMLGTSIVSVIGRNLQTFILGRQLGASALGQYNLASGMTGTILFQVSAVVVRVLFPTMSQLKDDKPRLQNAWLKAVSMIALLGFPAMAGIISVASDLVPVVFGEQWTPMVNVLRILSAAMAVQCVLTTSGTVLLALGRADINFRISLVSVPFIAIALLYGSRHGIEGAAIGYAVVSITTNFVITALACREARLQTTLLLMEVMPWLLNSLLMALSVAFLASVLDSLHAPIRLGLCIGSGAILYPTLLWIFARSRTRALIGDVFSRLMTDRK